jgi:hypothetical protein
MLTVLQLLLQLHIYLVGCFSVSDSSVQLVRPSPSGPMEDAFNRNRPIATAAILL